MASVKTDYFDILSTNSMFSLSNPQNKNAVIASEEGWSLFIIYEKTEQKKTVKIPYK